MASFFASQGALFASPRTKSRLTSPLKHSTSRRVRAGWALLIATIATAPRPAHADDATEAGLRFTAGKVALEDALSQRRRGAVESSRRLLHAAISEFLTSNRLSPNVNAAFNVAYCLEELGDDNDAFSAYEEFLGLAKTPEDLAAGREALERLGKRVARVSVTTSPPGASLYVDRENLGRYGQAPRTLALAPGPHRLIAILEDYEIRTASVAATKGAEVVLHLELTRKRGRVRLDSEPSGAIVRVEGSSDALGKTPVELDLPVGVARIAFEREGSRPTSVELTVRPNRLERAAVTLQETPQPKGRLRVLTNLDGAFIELDGLEAGLNSLITDVVAGPHRLHVQKPGFQPWEGPVDVKPGALSAVDVRLEVDTPERGHGPLPWILLASGAASAAVAGGFGVAAALAGSDFAAAPNRPDYDRATSSAQAADILWGVTGTLALSALIAWFATEPLVVPPSSAEVRQ